MKKKFNSNSMFEFESRTMVTTAIRSSNKIKVNFNEEKQVSLTFLDLVGNYEIFIKNNFGVVMYREYYHNKDTKNIFNFSVLPVGNYYLEIEDNLNVSLIPLIVNEHTIIINEVIYVNSNKRFNYDASLKIA